MSLKCRLRGNSHGADGQREADLIDKLEADLIDMFYSGKSPSIPDGMDIQDANRYRWLRAEVDGTCLPMAQVVWKLNCIRDSDKWTNLSDGSTLDDHIDAEMKLGEFNKELKK